MAIPFRAIFAAALPALLLAAHASDAADSQPTAQAGDGELGEVVVTARRSSENIQDMPLVQRQPR